MGLNFESLEMQAIELKRVDKPFGVICLFIIFTSSVMIIKMSKMADFCNCISPSWAKHLSASKRLI